MTVLTEKGNSFYLTSLASLVETDRDTATTWASKHIVSNEAIKWIVGKYVEADNANSNGQYWTLKDLQMKRPTLTHSPMNMGHKQTSIVGTFVASDLIYPTEDAAAVQENPYIEALGAFWRYYFPNELKTVEAAFESGSLFLSMECVGDTVTCGGDQGCGDTFPYRGPMDDSYCSHIKEHASYRQLNDPHFLGGALVVPPFKPGWKNADVKDISNLAQEKLYGELAVESPNADPKSLEYATLALLLARPKQKDNSRSARQIGREVGLKLALR
jgi:hypothetical protein